MAEPELVVVLRELLDACPVPAQWHPGYEAIGEVFADFRAAVEALEGAGTAPRGDEQEAVAAARARLEALPRPEGQHPYLDTIEPTLEAIEAAFDLLDENVRAAAAFTLVRGPVAGP